MLLIIVPAGTAVTGGPAYGFKTTGPIASALVLAFIDIALHQHHRMTPAFLPVNLEPLQAQGQHSRGQIRVALAVGQNQETAVVDHQTQPPRPLTWGPADLVLTGFGVRS